MQKSIQHKKYQRNPHVHLDGCEENGQYVLTCEFKDHKQKYQVITVSYPVPVMLKMIERFRFPRKYMQGRRMSKLELVMWNNSRDNALNKGMFMIKDNKLRPDPSAIVNYYAEVFCRPIAIQLQEMLHRYGMDTRRERIELAMKFVQDIPYAIPYQNDPRYMYGGLITPPEILYMKFGDCDSKSFLFGGILAYLIDPRDIGFLTVPGHLFTVIRETQLEKDMVFMGAGQHKYVVAETAGPHRINYGQPSQYKIGEIDLHPLQYQGRHGIIPYGNQANVQKRSYKLFKAPKEKTDTTLMQTLNTLKKKKKRIKCMVFNDKGGWLILAGKNNIYQQNIPQNLLKTLQEVQQAGHEITDIALSNRDEFVVMYHKGFGFLSSVYDKTGDTLQPFLNEVTEVHGLPIKDVIFSNHHPTGWIAIYQDDHKGFGGKVKGKSGDELAKALQQLAKKGIKSLSFTQSNGWALIFGKNGHALFLPKKLKKELTHVLNQLIKKKAEINKIYFTPTDEWIIIYNKYRYVTSL